ncbi:MAG: hypothetical protein H7833_10350 [Magnetococcus sp. DMHC-1]|nr:hypothetical protein [Magnetococcales bacterium]
MASQAPFVVPITLLIVGWAALEESVAGEWGVPTSPDFMAPGNKRGNSDDKLGRRFGRFMGSFMEEMDKNSAQESEPGEQRYSRSEPGSDRDPRPQEYDHQDRRNFYDPPRYRGSEAPGSGSREDDDRREYRNRSSRYDNRYDQDETNWNRRRYRSSVPDYDPWEANAPYGYADRRWNGYGYGRGYGYYPNYDPWGAAYPPLDPGPAYGLGYTPGWGSPYSHPGWGDEPWGARADPLLQEPWWHEGGGFFGPQARWRDPFLGTPWSWGGGSWFW